MSREKRRMERKTILNPICRLSEFVCGRIRPVRAFFSGALECVDNKARLAFRRA